MNGIYGDMCPICHQRRHRMPNNGFSEANGANTHLDEDKTRRTHRGTADDISGATTEDLVAIFGGKSDSGKPQADPLDKFDDSPSHGKVEHKSAKTDSRRRNACHVVDRARRNGSGQIARGKSTNGAEHIRNSNGDRKTATPDKKKKAAKIIAISLLSVIAVGGIGYAAWNLTPLHSMFNGDSSSSSENESSIDSEARGRTVNSEKLDFTFEHKGIKYTFTDLTSVAPSETKSANGRETFKVTLKAVNGTDEDYQMTSIGVNVFGPNGDYLADMIRNDTVLEDGIDSIEDPVIPSGETYERTLEIPATKSGTYTLEVIDVGTDEIFRVPVDIKVKD